jgi:hypothetical protein
MAPGATTRRAIDRSRAATVRFLGLAPSRGPVGRRGSTPVAPRNTIEIGD